LTDFTEKSGGKMGNLRRAEAPLRGGQKKKGRGKLIMRNGLKGRSPVWKIPTKKYITRNSGGVKAGTVMHRREKKTNAEKLEKTKNRNFNDEANGNILREETKNRYGKKKYSNAKS